MPPVKTLLDPEDFPDIDIKDYLHPCGRPFFFSDEILPENHIPDISPYTIVPRDDWGAREPAFAYKMNHPIKTVRFVFEDFKKYDENNLINALRLCQKHHIEEKRLYDIPYNFIISKGGIIFEGRGWDSSPASVDKAGDTLDICFVGDYSAEFNHPKYSLMEAAYSLVNTGIKEEKIAPDHNVIAMKIGAKATDREREIYADWSSY